MLHPTLARPPAHPPTHHLVPPASFAGVDVEGCDSAGKPTCDSLKAGFYTNPVAIEVGLWGVRTWQAGWHE